MESGASVSFQIALSVLSTTTPRCSENFLSQCKPGSVTLLLQSLCGSQVPFMTDPSALCRLPSPHLQFYQSFPQIVHRWSQCQARCSPLCRCSVSVCGTQENTPVKEQAGCLPAGNAQLDGLSWPKCPIRPRRARAAHLVEERVVSHLGTCVVLMASNDHLHQWLEVVAHELAGFKHLHLDLPGTK